LLNLGFLGSRDTVRLKYHQKHYQKITIATVKKLTSFGA
jgi:hypothetical protein